MRATSNQPIQKYLLSLPTALMEKVQHEAQEKFRTQSGQVSYILEQYYSRQEKIHNINTPLPQNTP